MSTLDLLEAVVRSGAALEPIPPDVLRVRNGAHLDPALLDALRAEKPNLLNILTSTGLAEYLAYLARWQPEHGADLPATPPFRFESLGHEIGWGCWWITVDRRNRVFRQGRYRND